MLSSRILTQLNDHRSRIAPPAYRLSTRRAMAGAAPSPYSDRIAYDSGAECMIAHRPRHRIAALLSAIAVTGCASAAGPRAGAAPEAEMDALVQQVEIRRTHYGVPHILAQNLRAAAFALAYVQLEDHGERIIEGMN